MSSIMLSVSSPLDSFQPMNGETKKAPMRIACNACAAENTNVRLARMPFSLSTATDL